jgi:hypothetical protein
MIKKRPISPPVLLTQSSSFITRIKNTFSKNKSQEALTEHKEEILIDQLTTEIVKKKLDDDLLIPIDNSSSTSSFEEDDNEEEALEQRLVRQVTEMFSRSMFIYSNTCGRNIYRYVTLVTYAYE